MTAFTPPVLVEGRYLWKDDQRFLVRGVVYQDHDNDDSSLAGRDKLSDDHIEQLQHDLPLFRELGVNTVHVYSIDYTKSHAKAMKLLEEAGIYIVFSLVSPQHCIHRINPLASYNAENLSVFFRTLDAMASFPNTLGVLITDHLINNTKSEGCAPVIKAVVRDLKNYMDLRKRAVGQRVLPLGFGGSSHERDRAVLAHLAAGESETCVDFWTCTGFAPTGTSSIARNGYNHLIQKYRDITIPIFMSEYGSGITTRAPRAFDETIALYSPKMTGVFSGGCVYELWQGSNGYGLALLRRKVARSRRAPPKPGTIVETRETESGTLLLFEDFMNYKQRLAETAHLPTHRDQRPAVEQGTADDPALVFDDTPIHGTMPESCVDWSAITEKLGSAG